MLALVFGEEAWRVATDFAVVGINVTAIKGEGWLADDFVSEAGIISGRFVEYEAWEIFERSVLGDVARFHAVESGESARERLGVIVAVFDSEVDELGSRGDEVGSGAGEPAFADIFREIDAGDEGKKSAHDIGVGVHVCSEAIVANSIVEMLLDFGGDLIEGAVDVHRDGFGSLGYYNMECRGEKVVMS